MNSKKMVTLKDIINSGMIENGTDILVSEKYKNGVAVVTTNIISDYLNHEVINISPFSPNAVCVNVKSKKDNDFVPDLTESKNMTIGDLKEAIKYLPDNMKVFIPLYEGTEENIIPVDHCYANIAGIIDDKLYGKGFTFGTLSDASNLTMERIYQATKGTVCVEQLFPELDKSETEKQKPKKTNKQKPNKLQSINAKSGVFEEFVEIPMGVVDKSVEEVIKRIHSTNEKEGSFQIKLILQRKYDDVDLSSYISAYSKIDIDDVFENKVISERFKDLTVDIAMITKKFSGTPQEQKIYRIYINMDESKNEDVVSKNIDVINQIIRTLTPKQQHHYEDCPNGDAPDKNNLIRSRCDDKDKSETEKQKPKKTNKQKPNKPQTINAESDVPEIFAGTPIITGIIGKSVEEVIERIHSTNEKQKIESFEIKLILKRKYDEVDLLSYISAHYPKTDTDADIEEKIISEKFKDLTVDGAQITQKFLGTSYEHTIYRIYINMDKSKNADVIDQIIRSLTPKQQYHYYDDCPNGDAPNKNNLICWNCDDRNKCEKKTV